MAIKSDISSTREWHYGEAPKGLYWTVYQTNADGTTSTAKEIVTGWTTRLSVADHYDSVTERLSKVGAVIDGPNGVVGVTLQTADYATITPGQYVYTMWRTGTLAVIAYGIAVIHDPLPNA